MPCCCTVTYPTKYKRLRAAFPRSSLRRVQRTIGSNEGLARGLARGHRIARRFFRNATAWYLNAFGSFRWRLKDPNATIGDVTHYLSALLGKLRRSSWPCEDRLRLSRRSGRGRGPTPLLEVLRRAHRGPGGGVCSAGEFLPIGILRTSP